MPLLGACFLGHALSLGRVHKGVQRWYKAVLSSETRGSSQRLVSCLVPRAGLRLPRASLRIASDCPLAAPELPLASASLPLASAGAYVSHPHRLVRAGRDVVSTERSAHAQQSRVVISERCGVSL